MNTYTDKMVKTTGFRHIIRLVLNPLAKNSQLIENYTRVCTCKWVGGATDSHPPKSLEDAIASL